MLSDEEIMLVETGDPYIFLDSLHRMSKRPDRNEVCFDWESLKWISRAWDEAALALVGDTTAKDLALHEAQRYRHLSKQLELAAMNRHAPPAIMVMDSDSDWPHEQVILRAMAALRYAEIPMVH
jgi:hypothetical protein